MWLQRERKDDVIWSDLKLGGHLELNAILFQSWSKLRSRSKLTSFIGSNISRSSSNTTLWFLQVKHQHLKTNLKGFLSHLHILIFSNSNLKLQVFGLFSRFVRTLIIKISSSEGPANTTSIHRVRNIGILVIHFLFFLGACAAKCPSAALLTIYLGRSFPRHVRSLSVAYRIFFAVFYRVSFSEGS